MEYRRVGRSGLEVSAIGLGTVLFGKHVDEPRVREIVGAAIDAGVTLFDTSDSYADGESERLLGRALGTHRRDVVVATKFSSQVGTHRLEGGTSRRWLMLAVEASLRRLATDTIDLYQIHHPDPLTPIDETLRALDDLVTAGKVRYVGYSNVAAWQLVDGQWTARTEHLARPISTTNHFSLLRRDPELELLPAARAHGLGVIPYYPLELGFLTGRYRPDAPASGIRLVRSPREASVLTTANFERLARWEAFAADHGRSMVDLAIAWLLAHPEVPSVIAGVTSPAQLAANVAAAAWRLTPEALAEVAALT